MAYRTNSRNVLWFVFLIAVFSAVTNAQVYFTRDTDVRKVPLAGGSSTFLYSGCSGVPFCTEVIDITVDDSAGMLYWVAVDSAAFGGTHYILRAAADGSGSPSIIVTRQDKIGRITLNPAGNKVFWTETDSNGVGSIMRSSLTGGSVTKLYDGGGFFDNFTNPLAIAVDTTNNRIYWSDDDGIKKAPIAGGGTVTNINSNGAGAIAITLDVAGSKLYFAKGGFGSGIFRTTLTGASLTSLYWASNGYVITALGANLAGAKIYWSEDGSSGSAIRKAPIGGGGTVTTVLSPATGLISGIYVNS